MPAYSATTIPTALYPGDSATVFSQEQPTTGSKSAQVALGNLPADNEPSVSVELAWTSDAAGATPADPGVFSISLQDADTDADKYYITNAAAAFTITAVTATNFTARAELQLKSRLCRLIVNTQSANNRFLTARIIR